MAKFEQRPNTGSLFKNDKREKDTHPHATGSALIDGVEYWVSAWTKEGKSGKFQSLAFKRKEEKTADGGVKRNAGKLEEDSEIPF
jgi:type II secretory pathway component PulJ